jgi:hypothetical protein
MQEKLKCKIKLTREYLWHNPADDIFDSGRKAKTATAGNDPNEWKKTYTANKDGKLYIKSEQIFGCMREGGKFTKQGKGNLKSAIAATLQVEEDKIYLPLVVKSGQDLFTNDLSQPVYIDKRPVKNPATKAMNMRYRLAAAPGIEAEFTLTYDNTILNQGQVSSVLTDAGRMVGIGDGRSIGKGRFEVVSVEPV